MKPILYIETNFAITVAKGQDKEAGKFLERKSSAVRVVIPGTCFTEALSVLVDERKGRTKFRVELLRHAKEAKRDLTSAHGGELAKLLVQAASRGDELLNDIEARLYQSLVQISSIAEILRLESRTLEAALGTPILSDPIDNMILCGVILHAEQNAGLRKAFLSANSQDFGRKDIIELLALAEVQYFHHIRPALKWLSESGGSNTGSP